MELKLYFRNTYAAVLHALGGMDKDFELVAQDDEYGRRIQDMNLVTPKRAKRKILL